MSDTRSDGSFSIGSNVWPGTAKLIEEMGELQQVLGKLIAMHGDIGEHWDGTHLGERLQDELGDVLAAAQFFITQNRLDNHAIQLKFRTKLSLFFGWHEAQQ